MSKFFVGGHICEKTPSR